MTVRLRAPRHPGDKSTFYHAHQKVAHRADHSVVVEAGNHDAAGRDLAPLRGWHPIEVLHFSLRSVEQIELKGRGGWSRSHASSAVEHKRTLMTAVRGGRAAEYFDQHVCSDDDLARGLDDGTLAIDTRLRDALRLLRSPGGGYRAPDGTSPLRFEPPEADDAASYAAETSRLAEIDGIVRAERRVRALEERLGRLHRLPPR
jgi:hypothetical protein